MVLDQQKSEIADAVPRLRHDFETSRRMVTRAVERATRLADEAVAMRRLLETRSHTPGTAARLRGTTTSRFGLV